MSSSPESQLIRPISSPSIPCTSSTVSPSSSTSKDGAHVGPDGQPVKRGRRSNPKVKTGCSNCKQRRIKCDELRPACTQCVRSNKVCTGYPPPPRSARPLADIRIAPKPMLAIRSQAASGIASSSIVKPTVLPPRRANRRKRQSVVTQHTLLAAATPLTLHQPSNTLGFQQVEGLYFELFRVQTSSELSGYFNSNFWAQRVLQECHAESAIRHSVVALGALYKTLEQSHYIPIISPDKKEMLQGTLESHWQVAVNQYSDAMNSMMLLHGQSLRSFRTRLMASILLACFDSFIGDHKQAIIQIQTGLSLLEQLKTLYPNHRTPGPEGYIEDDLLNIFTRLAIQAKSYDMAFHFPQPYVIRLTPQQQSRGSSPVSSDIGSPGSPPSIIVPPRFESLLEARLASDKLCERLLKFIERLQIAKNNKSNVLPESWRQYGIDLKSELDSWAVAFEHIFQSRFDPRVSLIEKAGISALKMFQINSNVLFLMMFCDTEVKFDAFLPHFKAIVDLGWEVVSAEECRAAVEGKVKTEDDQNQYANTKGAFRAGKLNTPHIKPSFSADLGIVPPLFVVATKCREPRLRRQAIQLLRSSARREGMWDSELAANIGLWVMQIEESYGDLSMGWDESVLPLEPIPEEKRVMVKSADFDLRARFAELRVGTRAVHEGSHDDRVRTTRIMW
ncbi:Zn(2)-Cys(6) zinc finger domain protein [Metarhizium robertsii]|uniref:Heat-labile enterotoxin, A chain n=2 Tax=Metarhizium robertsii TaxID=568076 RepID=A0A0B2XFX1_METRA|nr:Heat-labile enterotoxin, A chain [Metarhizium robertsii ARSEF 23]EXU96582.1 Zn(2)-Cys(6) zinc finger domain protein [Metarhizium robertsii]KHO10836.1 Heat-labile enterotoxin, A chain [Metarhizium robertsii ARSEF 23]